MTGAFTRVYHSLVFYPATIVYGSAAVLAAAVPSHVLHLDMALVLLILVVVAVLLLATHKEVGTTRLEVSITYQEVGKVHTLVNSQHDDLIATVSKMSIRIDQLLAAMRAAEVAIPHDNSGVDP